MDNDKVFTAYALILFAGVASLITASIVTGIASLPTPVSFLEHLAMSFGFRAAYKSLGGWAGTIGAARSRTTEVPSTATLEPATEPSVA